MFDEFEEWFDEPAEDYLEIEAVLGHRVVTELGWDYNYE